MIHILLIAALAAIVLRDELGPGWGEWVGAWQAQIGGRALEVTIAALAAIAAATHLYVRRQGRLMDRRGSGRAILRAERAVTAARVGGVVVHAAGVLVLGTLDEIRGWIGDWVLVDEALCAIPPVLLFVAGWWSLYPIDRRVREAILLRHLDEGRIVHPLPTRGAFVLTQARHQLALVLLPVLLIFAWGEGAERALAAWGGLGRRPAWVDADLWARLRVLVLPAVQLVGVAGVFALAPFILRRVWDTVRLGPGELRDALTDLCDAARVRVRDLLVWRTGGTMINGAVVGLVGRMRYILLTDALLESLTPGQVRAVTAHEVGHVRRGHMAWLAAGVLAAIFGAALGADLLVRWADPGGAVRVAVQGAGTVLSLAFGLLVFGHASRRFEWQADAFAAAHLSGHRDVRGGAVVVTPESVDDMTGALQAVADLNHVPVGRFSWRHGSIGERQARLRSLVGKRTDRLAADRAASWVKALTAGAFLLVIAGIVADLSRF